MSVAPASRDLSSVSAIDHHRLGHVLSGGALSPNDNPRMVDELEFAPQVVRGLNAMVNQRGGAMTLRLDPPDLGELRVHMTISRGAVIAEFTAATQQTAGLLDKNMTVLRQALESQGLTVERLAIHTPGAASTHQHSLGRDESGPNGQSSFWANHHDAGGSESRGRREQDAHHARAWQAEEFSLESLFDADVGAGRERTLVAAAAHSPAGADRRHQRHIQPAGVRS
jgi:hypothetical protein